MTKREKAAYDKEYRKRNKERIRARAATYFQRTYDPVKAAKERKKKMPQHVEYCRQPRYRSYKKKYDKAHRASKFGLFAESYLLLQELTKEIRRQMPDRFERYAQTGRKQWSPINQFRYRRNKWLKTLTTLQLSL